MKDVINLKENWSCMKRNEKREYGVIVLKENTPEIRRKILDSGISVCVCAEFNDSCWLDFHPNLVKDFKVMHVHGVGYPYEGETKESTLAIFLHEAKDPYFCKDVDEFIKMVKECLV